LTAAKLWFLVTATVINIGLPRLLGDPALFGAYKVVAGFLAVASMVVLAGALQTASKGVSESPACARLVCRRAERTAGGIAFTLALLLFVGADLVADLLWQDPGLALPLRIATVVVAVYGVYATWIGVANGLKHYRTQALFDIVFATLKTGGIIAAVLVGLGVVGIFAAFSLIAVLMAAAAFVVIARRAPGGAGGEGEAMRPGRMLRFIGGVMGFNLTLNLLLQGDVVLLKGLVHEASLDALGAAGGLGAALLCGLSPGGAALDPDTLAREATSSLAGLYGAVRNVTMIPYSGIISLTFVVFPVLSAATFSGDRRRTEATVQGAVRFALILVSLLCGFIVLSDELLLGLLFGRVYRDGVVFLIPMAASTVSFALYVVLTSMLTAAGYPGRVLIIGALATFAHLLLVTGAGSLEGVPYTRAIAMAWATVLGPLLGMLASAFAIVRLLHVGLPWLSGLRICGGAVAAAGLALWLTSAPELSQVALRLVVLLFVCPLIWVLTGELGRAELAAVTRLLGLRRSS